MLFLDFSILYSYVFVFFYSSVPMFFLLWNIFIVLLRLNYFLYKYNDIFIKIYILKILMYLIV